MLTNRGADPRARRMGAGAPADIRRAQSGQVPCSGARRRGKALDEVSAAIPRDAVARNMHITKQSSGCVTRPADFDRYARRCQEIQMELSRPRQSQGDTFFRAVPMVVNAYGI